MRLLLDECVTRYLKQDLSGHEVFTVAEAGLKGLRNGALLRAAFGRFDVLITVDRSMIHQQNIESANISILICRGPRVTYKELHVLAPHLLEALKSIKPGETIEIW